MANTAQNPVLGQVAARSKLYLVVCAALSSLSCGARLKQPEHQSAGQPSRGDSGVENASSGYTPDKETQGAAPQAPSPSSSSPDSDSGAASESFPQAVARVRSLIPQLYDAGVPSAALGQILEAISAALAAAPGESPDSQQAEKDVREHGSQLQDGQVDPFEITARAKTALQAALSAIAAHQQESGLASELAPWIETARRAIASIDGTALLAFERPQLQDACRTISDVLQLWSQLGPGPTTQQKTPAAASL
jgi:hypothetical protein